MADLFLLSEAQMRRIEPYFPLSHGIARVDDRRVISGIVFVIRNGLRWRDAPSDYGPHKTIYESRRVVGGSMKAEMTAQLVADAPIMAICDVAGRTPCSITPTRAANTRAIISSA